MSRYLPLTIVVLLFYLAMPPVYAALTVPNCDKLTPNMNDLSTPIDQLVTAAIERGEIPGAVVWISRQGCTLHHRAYGHAYLYDMGEPLSKPVPMQPDTIFDLASVTKVMATTLGIIKLISDGKLSTADLHQPISAFLSIEDKQPSTSTAANATLAELLTHTAGLAPWLPLYLDVHTRADTLDYLYHLPRGEPPYTQQYSDLGFMLLGFVIEAVAKQPLEDYLTTTLYQPLGLQHTGFTPHTDQPIAATSWGNPYEYQMIADDTFGYTIAKDPNEFTGWRHYTLLGEVNDGNAFYANEGVAGHAGLFTTARDLAVLGQLLLDGGQYRGQNVLNSEVIDLFTTTVRDENDATDDCNPAMSNDYGYGVEIYRPSYMGCYAPTDTIGHTGFTGTQWMINKAHGIQVIVLTNRQNNGRQDNGYYYSTRPLTADIADLVFGAL